MSETREKVREFYSRVGACCGAEMTEVEETMSRAIGYGDELKSLPQGANLGLGCGNPVAIASLATGQTVVDLGSGGGIDAFLAAEKVGPTGHVIGVDMAAPMIDRARKNAAESGLDMVEFRLGEIENLPIADHRADVVISNCVVNLSDQKQRVWNEVFRVLKPGGRVAISDVLAEKALPETVLDSVRALVSCVAGASTIDELVSMLQSAGFEQIKVETNSESKAFIKEWVPGSSLEEYVVAATIEAIKPS